MSELVIVEKELSYLIMQAAYEVHNELGPGFLESIYEEAMNRELTRCGIQLERQKEVVVCFKGEPLGKFFLDNVVNGRVILEYKTVSEIAPIHKQQALSYLKATHLELAIVINSCYASKAPSPQRTRSSQRFLKGFLRVLSALRGETA